MIKRKCENCWRTTNGQEYPFYIIEILNTYSYDRTVSSSASRTITATHSTTRYKNHGTLNAFICNRCVIKKALNTNLLIIGIILIAVLTLGFLFQLAGEAEVFYSAVGFSGLLLLFGIYILIRMTRAMSSSDPEIQKKILKNINTEEIGSKLAIKNKERWVKLNISGKLLLLTPSQKKEFGF